MNKKERYRIIHLSAISSLCFYVFVFLCSLPTLTFSQTKIYGEVEVLDSIVFKDTIQGWTTDSLEHNLGLVAPINRKLVKYFKYVGNDTLTITRAWTGDPHYICEYPTEPLINGKIYSFTICFWFDGRQGLFIREMGFNLSNGQIISYIFKGEIQNEEDVDFH